MHCACAKRPYFNFRSKISGHYSLPRSRFRLRGENFGDSGINKGYIAYVHRAWIFRTTWLKMEVFLAGWGKIGKELCKQTAPSAGNNLIRYRNSQAIKNERTNDPERTRFYFWGFFRICQFGGNRPRNSTVRVHANGYTDTPTHWRTQTDFIICSML